MSISTIWQNFCEIVETWNWFSSTFQAQFYVKLNFRFLLKSLIWRILCSNFYGSRVLKKIREIEFSSNNSTNKKDVIWRNFLFFRPLIDWFINIYMSYLARMSHEFTKISSERETIRSLDSLQTPQTSDKFTTKWFSDKNWENYVLTKRNCYEITQPHYEKLTFVKSKASIVLTFDPALKCKHLPRKEKNYCVKIKC